jgi:hypothetical protein
MRMAVTWGSEKSKALYLLHGAEMSGRGLRKKRGVQEEYTVGV